MAGAANCKRFLNILQRWPIDESKSGRDLGTFLRESVSKAHKEGKLEENQKYWDRQYVSLQKIINCEHQKIYPRLLSSSATGLTAEQCNLALSTEFLEQWEIEEQSIFKRMFSFKSSPT